MRRIALSFVLFTLGAAVASAQEKAGDLAAETVVVYNPEFPQSRELAEFYAQKRGISDERVVGLKCPIGDSMSRQEFDALLRKPLIDIFSRRQWWNLGPQPERGAQSSKIRVLVLMRGVPFQVRRNIQNPKNAQEDEASVDSELALLGAPAHALAGAVRNPYHERTMRYQEFTSAPGLLLVGRLDGPDPETVKRMIEDAIAVEETGLRGRAVIDLALKTGAYAKGEEWLRESASILRRKGVPVYVDEDEPVIIDQWPLPDTALYFGWYTTDASGGVNSPSFQFSRGAVACHLHSFSASVLRSADRGWAGPLLKKGAAATMGNVFEPYLALTVHFDLFNQRLLEGWTLAEAAWNATPVLSWMSVVVGDPLYRPFGKSAGTRMGEGSDRDYALYRATVARFGDEEAATRKSTLTEMAVDRSNGHLLELTGLLAASEGRLDQALGLLEHAETIYERPADRLRVALYQCEYHRRGAHFDTVREILTKVIGDPAFKAEPHLEAARRMLKALP